jgi:hypothetical protein
VKRTEHLHIRLTRTEKAVILAKARSVGAKVSKWARKRLLGK